MNEFTAPIGGSNKVDNVEMIPIGFQLCTFYGLCDIGHQDTKFGSKHKVALAFEFPEHFRVFYEGEDAKPSAIFSDETLSMHVDSNLRKKFIQPMTGGKKMTDAEALKFDLSSLLGQHFVATIVHSSDGQYSNIQSISPLNEQNKALFNLPTVSVAQTNPTHFFHLGLGFDSTNFGNLPKYLRNKLVISEEGKAHTLAGGSFAEPDTGANASGRVSAPPSTPGAVRETKFVMIDKNNSYQSYIDAKWTEEQMIENGIGKRVVATPPPTPVTQAAPPPPSATPPPPSSPEPKLVMNDPAQVAADWIAGGWTQEQIIEGGHGKLV